MSTISRDLEYHPLNLALLRYATVRELQASGAGETRTVLFSKRGALRVLLRSALGARGRGGKGRGEGEGGRLVFVRFCCCFWKHNASAAPLSGPEPSRLLSASATAPMGTIIRRQGGPAGFPARLGVGARCE